MENEKLNFTEKELEILHAVVTKEKVGLNPMISETVMGKESLENYFKELLNLELKISEARKEKIEILIITNTVKQSNLKATDFIKNLDNKIANFELGKKVFANLVSDDLNKVTPISLKVEFGKFYNCIYIEVENDNKIKEITIRFMGSERMTDGMRFDAFFIDYATFYNKEIYYNNLIGRKLSELEQKLLPATVTSKYYKKELPQLVKWLLD